VSGRFVVVDKTAVASIVLNIPKIIEDAGRRQLSESTGA
jgi:hypothetical protein